MTDERPNPDAVLARVLAEHAHRARGRLKVFFGAAPGVGKTYAMLQAARQRKQQGEDVVIAWLETHGRKDTEQLAEGLEQVPPRVVEHQGIELRDMDLERVLARKPGLALVDEFPHTNAPGSPHEKRWQDVEDLLDAGIDVYTTANVQHLESMNDVVARITGVRVRETIPDAVFDRAAEVELIDLPPDELMQRLREGKVYVTVEVQRALDNFFRKGNLIALRELALRRTAERVDAEAVQWRKQHDIHEAWPTRDRVLAVVGPEPSDAAVLRAASRLASRLQAPWLATLVDSTRDGDAERMQIQIALAERLGAEVIAVRSNRLGTELAALVGARNVTRVVMRQPPRGVLGASFARTQRRLWHELGGVEIVLVPPDTQVAASGRLRGEAFAPIRQYGWSLVAVGVSTLVCWFARPVLTLADDAMVYLLAVLAIASRCSRGPAIATSVLGVAALDFFFVPPFYTLAIADARFVVTFAIMLIAALTVSTLTLRVRGQADAALLREQRAAAFSAMGRELSRLADPAAIVKVALGYIDELVDVDAAVSLSVPAMNAAEQDFGTAGDRAASSTRVRKFGLERLLEGADHGAVIRWVLEHGRAGGLGTDTLPNVAVLCLPLEGSMRRLGVIVVAPRGSNVLTLSQRQLLDTLAERVGAAIERTTLANEAMNARIRAETEHTRGTLLAAISHDLRTPLASIAGAASVLGDERSQLDAPGRQELVASIRDEAERLTRLVNDLLDLTRLQSGAMHVRKEWVPIEDVLGSSVGRVRKAFPTASIRVQLPDAVLWGHVDPVLIEQVVINIVENAIRHAGDSAVDVSAWREPGRMILAIEDRGPGIPRGQEERIFDKFFRAGDGEKTRGSGLGLAVCRAIVHAHGGHVTASARAGGGLTMTVVLPLDHEPPAIPGDPSSTPSSMEGDDASEVVTS